MDMLESYSVGDSDMIHETLDDVGTCEKDGIVATVGYVAYKQNWDAFNWAWSRALKAIGLGHLHTSEYLYKYLRVGDHSPTDDEIFHCLSPFIKIIVERLLNPPRTGFGVCIITRCEAYEQLSEEEREYIREPELNSFELAVGLGCMKVQRELTLQNSIAVQMDESHSVPRLYGSYELMKRENELLKKFLGAICFADDKLHPPIQAADLLGCLTLRAWKAFHANQEWPTAFKRLISPGDAINVVPIICGSEFLKGLADMRRKRNDRAAMPDLYV